MRCKYLDLQVWIKVKVGKMWLLAISEVTAYCCINAYGMNVDNAFLNRYTNSYSPSWVIYFIKKL